MESLCGNIIKGYELGATIGSGGFGEVYKAYQAAVGREVAVKIILSQYSNQPEFIRRFEAEAHFIARLEHLHIVPLYDYWRDDAGAYLVMRLLRGGSLKDMLKNGAIALETAIMFLDQIASALATAHRNRVIHRDLKPENILLDEDNNAYLGDFGIAKDLNLQQQWTEVNTIIGTASYLAPEQARSEPVTPQTDIYSLGVVLYEMVAGNHPFSNTSLIEQIYKHLHEPLPEIKTLPAHITDDVNAVIQKATAKDPKHRFGDVLEMAAAFHRAAHISPRERIAGTLTRREHEILHLIVAGYSNQQIADKLFFALTTVKSYNTEIYRKLGVRSRVQAIFRARELGLAGAPQQSSPATKAVALPLSSTVQLQNPYKGLRAFQSADNQDFFGREKLVEKLVNRLKDNHAHARFLAVVGPSGSGKSSLVKAGLIPALWRGDIAGSEHWFIVEMLPGNNPLDELEAALNRVTTNRIDNLIEQLHQQQDSLLRSVDLILPADGSEFVLVVDQFEEVFTLVTDEVVRRHFLDLLYTAITAASSRVRIIVTLRADFYDRPLHYPRFGELLRSRMETILPMSAEELELAIMQPTQRNGVIFEQGLVASIVSEVSDQPASLPLLQYALTELFEQRQGQVLTHEAYLKIGRTIGALAKHADELYLELDTAGQEATRQLFMRLVTLGEGAEDTRRRVLRSEIMAMTNNPDTMDEIIDTFTAHRLLSLDNDPDTRTPTVELAHEAILREWERLRGWLNDSREDIRLQRQLAVMASDWHESHQDTSFLLPGSRLTQFESWMAHTQLALTKHEHEFLRASIAERERQKAAEHKRKRTLKQLRYSLIGVLLAAVVVAFGLTAVALRNANQAQNNFLTAERIRLAAQAQIALDKGEDVRIPALFALRSLELGYSPEADAALLTALQRDFSRQVYTGHRGDGVGSVHFSPDGSHILTTGTDGTARLWDTLAGTEVLRLSGHVGLVTWADFAPTGDFILTSGTDGTVRQWDTTTGHEMRRVLEQDDPIRTFDLSSDGQLLLTGTESGVLKLWQFDQMELVHELLGAGNVVTQAAFSPDGQMLAAGCVDRVICLWDVTTGAEIRRFEGHAASVSGIGFAPDSSIVVSTSADSTTRLWDIESGTEIQRLINSSGAVRTAVFSPNGYLIATGGTDGVIRLWDVATGEEVQQLRGHTGDAGYVAFSPDGQFILSAATDNTARLWEIHHESEPRLFGRPFAAIHAAAVQMAVLINNNQHIISVVGSGAIQIWDVATRHSIQDMPIDSGGYITDAALVPNLSQVITTSDKGIIRLWNFNNGELLREYRGHEGEINKLTLAADGSRFATAGADNRAFIWSTDATVPLRQFQGHTKSINAIDLSFDNRLVVTGGDDGTVRLWDAETGVEIRQFAMDESVVLSITFSPDGAYILISCDDNTAQLWDVQTGMIVQTFVGHTASVSVAAFSADGQMVLTGSRDQTVRLWDTTNGAVIRQFVGQAGPILSASLAPDGNLLVVGDPLNTYLWRTHLEDIIVLTCDKLSSDFTADERRLYNIHDNREICSQQS
jgi:WD40 repeat protein/serine/threonine protein kinase